MFCGCSCDPNSILIPEMLIEFVLFVFLFFLFFFFPFLDLCPTSSLLSNADVNVGKRFVRFRAGMHL